MAGTVALSKVSFSSNDVMLELHHHRTTQSALKTFTFWL